MKIWDLWWTSPSHVGFGAAEHAIGPFLMFMANRHGRQPDGSGLVVIQGGSPVPLEILSRRFGLSRRAVMDAIDNIVSVGTMDRREDGTLVFPNLKRWQEDPSAERQRRRKERRESHVKFTHDNPQNKDHGSVKFTRDSIDQKSEVRSINKEKSRLPADAGPAVLNLELLEPGGKGRPSSAFVQSAWETRGGEEVTRWTALRLTALVRFFDVLDGFKGANETLEIVIGRYFDAVLSSEFCGGQNDRNWSASFNWVIGADRQWGKPVKREIFEERVRMALDGEYGSKPRPQPVASIPIRGVDFNEYARQLKQRELELDSRPEPTARGEMRIDGKVAKYEVRGGDA
jgi:hypothetical protein